MKRSRTRIAILSVLVASAFAFWWFKTPPPKVGGGQGDDLLAPWVKGRIYASVNPEDEKGFPRLTYENANGWYNISREPIQSFDYYRSLNPARPTPLRRTIVLQPMGSFDREQRQLLGTLREFCAAFFQLPVRLENPIPLPTSGNRTRPADSKKFGATALQFNADELIEKELAPRKPQDALAYLGITMSDLWVDNLSFVFGLGSADRQTGVYSLGRYYPKLGIALSEANRRLGLRRSCQVLDHEMGHMLGIYHCVLYKCSMNGSNSLADADGAPIDYCPVCLRKLLWNIGAESRQRQMDLLNFYNKHGLASEARLIESHFE